MEIATPIAELISQQGFPIGMCIILFVYIVYIQKQHKSEIDKLRQAVDNNTQVMQLLVNSLKEVK